MLANCTSKNIDDNLKEIAKKIIMQKKHEMRRNLKKHRFVINDKAKNEKVAGIGNKKIKEKSDQKKLEKQIKSAQTVGYQENKKILGIEGNKVKNKFSKERLEKQIDQIQIVGNKSVITENEEKKKIFGIDNNKIKDESTRERLEKQLGHIKIVECLEYVSIFKSIEQSISYALNYHRGLINKNTVIVGANKRWDAERLLLGKHESFKKIGTEHLLLTTKVGDKIDTIYCEAVTLADRIEKYGGKKSVFCITEESLEEKFEGAKEYTIYCLNKDLPIVKMPFEVLDKYSFVEIQNRFKHVQICALLGKRGNNNVYLIRESDLAQFQEIGLCDDDLKLNQVDLVEINPDKRILLVQNSAKTREIPGYYFEHFPSELEELFYSLGFQEAPWTFLKVDDSGYLVRQSDVDELSDAISSDISIDMFETKVVDSHGCGTVILTMNQTEIYEQYGSEILTFALEGLNVIAYNNGGKGLSKGGTTEQNINEALEAVYQYVRHVKLVPDHRILAKGQCFGGAPTAWLGAQHPDINLMLDQAPANFNETAIQCKNQFLEEAKVVGFAKFIGTSKLVDSCISIIMASYQLNELVKKNHGKQLIHIDIPDDEGRGGDTLVPDHHPELLIYNCKEPTLTKNPGGLHVTNWFGNSRNYMQIMEFMEENNLTTDLYEKSA